MGPSFLVYIGEGARRRGKGANAHGNPYRLNGKWFSPDIHAFPPRDPVCGHAVFVAWFALKTS
jgi:hypothetical protein